MTDRLRVMQAEKNGTVDLLTKQVDLYVIALPFGGLNNIINRIPVVGYTSSLAGKLTRFHVTGSWDSPVVEQELTDNISAATLDFFIGAAKAPGSFTPSFNGMFMNLFDVLSQTKPTPQTQPSSN